VLADLPCGFKRLHAIRRFDSCGQFKLRRSYQPRMMSVGFVQNRGRSQRKTDLRGSSRMINARKYRQTLCHDLRLEPIYRLLQSKAARILISPSAMKL